MAHKSFDTIISEIKEVAQRVTVGAAYAHYKDPTSRYIVTGLSILEDTDEVAVKYSPETAPEIEFIRPLSSWLETVSWQNAVVPRFTKV